MTPVAPTVGRTTTVDTELVSIPVYDLDAYCRQQTEQIKRRDAALNFSPPVEERPALWQPDTDREIPLFGPIDDEAAEYVFTLVRRLTRRRNRKPIWVSTNSAGGLADAGIAIYTVLREAVTLGVEVNVMVYGIGNSAASLVVQAASPARRFIMSDGWMLIHAPYWCGAEPPTRDERRKVRQMKRQFCEIYAARTGKSVDRLMRDTRRQLHLNAYDALRYGLVDRIEGLPLLPDRLVEATGGAR